jgi:NADH dehydrogenase FAD-containing subunit
MTGASEAAAAAALRFVVVGGAPESSELAARLAQFARFLERRQYKRVAKRGATATVQLVQVCMLACLLTCVCMF